MVKENTKQKVKEGLQKVLERHLFYEDQWDMFSQAKDDDWALQRKIMDSYSEKIPTTFAEVRIWRKRFIITSHIILLTKAMQFYVN